ncbi:MAG: hypothetical protein WDN06_16050 [Asticcacaulis sp.]
MLLKATAMDDPEDMPGIERAVPRRRRHRAPLQPLRPRRGPRPRSAQS